MKWKWEKVAMTQLPNRLGKRWKGTIFCLDTEAHTHATCQITLSLWNKLPCESLCFFFSFPTLSRFFFIFTTMCIKWYSLLRCGKRRRESFSLTTDPFCLRCHIQYDGPAGQSQQRHWWPPTPILPRVISITINSLNQNLCPTSIPISDHQLCEHWLRNNHLLNFHTSFLDKQTFELFFCLAVPVK